ncbi:MAG: hypothetical protein NTW21_34275 [Verrucomicrobia bacterium]|nr:hypothetical protein [Verrucomicrobiota bacterium]
MIRLLFPSLAAFLLGKTLAAAQPAPAPVAAEFHDPLEIPAGTTLKLAATSPEHGVRAPTALAFDDAGRMLITESRHRSHDVEAAPKHLAWYLDDLAARQPSARLALREKWQGQLPPAYLPDHTARVSRLADADGDGVFEDFRVFADGFTDPLDAAATGVLADQDGVYVGCLPKLWLLRDTDDDGVADSRKVLQDGFGVRLSPAGQDLRGFTLGPDGRLYGTIGDSGLNLTTKAGQTYQYPGEGCAFRFEADGSGFEVFHSGLRDPAGIAFDAFGNAFTMDGAAGQGDATRIIYLTEGGDSGWQMEHQAMHEHYRQLGLPALPPTRWLDEHMWELQHDLQPAYLLPPAAHLAATPRGLTSHPGTGFLEAEAGRFLFCELGRDAAHSGLDSFAMAPAGAGMQLRDSRQILRGLAATAVAYSWDGRLFITECGLHPVYALDAGTNTWHAAEAADTAKLMREGFTHRDSADLARLLMHPDSRIRLRAQIALTRMPDALERLATACASDDAMERLHGIWGLGILARRGSGVPVANPAGFGDLPDFKIRHTAAQQLVGLLKHPDAEVRAQAVRALGDAPNQFVKPPEVTGARQVPGPATFITAEGLPLAAMLFDTSPRVRYFAAIAIGKLKALGFYSAICDFLKANDNRDPYLRHAGAFAFQHMASNSLMLSGLERHESPAVRLAATVALRRRHDPAVATFIHDPDPKVADEAIRAVTDLSLDEVRISLAMLLDDLAARPWQPFMLRRLIHNAFRMGTAENAARLIKLLGEPTIPPEIQMETLRLLALWVEPPPVDQLTGHWRPLAKRDPAEIKPALTAELPRLLHLDGFVRSATLELIRLYQLEAPTTLTPPAVPSPPKR